MKRVLLNLRLAWRSLLNFKLRSALALLGVFLGTFSLIVVANLSTSLARKTQMEIDNLGKNLLIVRSGLVRRFGAGTRLISEATNLTLGDARAIAEGVPGLQEVSPAANRVFPLRRGDAALSAVLVTGVLPNYSETRNFYVREGSFIAAEDLERMRKVVVLGRTVSVKLFGEENPVGKTMLIQRVPCQVIGVMEEKGADLSGFDQDNQVFVPLTTYLRRLVNKDFINSVYLQVADGESMAAIKESVEMILRERHRIHGDKKDDFTVIDLKDVAALKTEAMAMIRVLGSIAATVSFLIGGIGILSIMILIVNERRVEIGIRRAVGSRKRDIVLQFLMESSFIALMGGMVGVVVALATSVAVFHFGKLPPSASAAGLLVAFAASVAVGVLAGIYPSLKATNIQPVDVIRS